MSDLSRVAMAIKDLENALREIGASGDFDLQVPRTDVRAIRHMLRSLSPDLVDDPKLPKDFRLMGHDIELT